MKRFISASLAFILMLEAVPASSASSIANSFHVILSPRTGFLTESYVPTGSNASRPDLILIQDLHANRSVQFAISRILKSLKDQNLMPGTIATEGATGAVDVASMQQFPDAKIRARAADYLVRQGEMPGDMHFVVSEGSGRLFGVETDEVYQANLTAYQRAYEARMNVTVELDKIAEALPTLRRDAALRVKAEQLQKDVTAVRRMLSLQIIPMEMQRTLHDSIDSIQRVQQVLPARMADSLTETLSSSANFYALALMRNDDLFEHTMALRAAEAQTTTVLITGGFHTGAIAEKAKAQGLSYIVLTPAVRRHTKVDERLYIRTILGQHLSAEQVADGRDWAATMLKASYANTSKLFAAVVTPKRRNPILPTIVLALGGLLPSIAMFSQVPQAPKVAQQIPSAPIRTLNDAATFILEQRADNGRGLPATFRIPRGVQIPADRNLIIRNGVGLYDSALAIRALTDAGRLKEAKEIISLYMEGMYEQMDLRAYPADKNQNAFKPFDQRAHYYFNFSPDDGNWRNGQWMYWDVRTGPNAWLAIAISHYIQQSGNRDGAYLQMVRRIGDAMIRLQDPAALGAVRFGPLGPNGQPQYFGNGPSSGDPFNTINSENIVSAYSAFNHLFAVTRDQKYQQAAQKLLTFMSQANLYNPDTRQMQKGMMNPDTRTFYVGAHYSAANRRWELETKTATDSGGTWAISSFGPETMDRIWGKGTAYQNWQHIRAHMGWTSDYKRPQASDAIAGLDFNDRYPASQALISPEWTAGGVKAVERLLVYSESEQGRGTITADQIAALKRDVQTMRAYLAAHPNHYADGPGMASPRDGATGWDWYSAPGDAIPAIYIHLKGDPLQTSGVPVTLVSAPPAIPPQTVKPIPAPVQPQAEAAPALAGQEIVSRPTNGYSGRNDFSSYANGPFDLTSFGKLRIHFDPGQAGNNVLIRLLPEGSAPDSQEGLIRKPIKIPASGIVEITISDSGLTKAELKSIGQISVHSGKTGWGVISLGESNGRVRFQSIEGVPSGRKGAGLFTFPKMDTYFAATRRFAANSMQSRSLQMVAGYLGMTAIVEARPSTASQALQQIAANPSDWHGLVIGLSLAVILGLSALLAQRQNREAVARTTHDALEKMEFSVRSELLAGAIRAIFIPLEDLHLSDAAMARLQNQHRSMGISAMLASA